MSTATLDRTDEQLDTEETDDDEPIVAHYVRAEELERVRQNLLNDTPLTAICGKKWLPMLEPSSFPVCGKCKAIYEGLQ